MEARELSESELNFARFTIICLDILTRVLKDILYIFIKPGQLVKRIKSNDELRFGDFKLNVDQLTKCCFYSPKDLPDYIEFDTTLLYKLIRNLCHKISPQEDWGKVPTEDDKGVVHDMNRIRELRNKHFAHAVSANISNEDYKKLWENSECIIQRCEAFTKTHGYRPKYNEELTKLNKNNMTFQEYQLCRDRSRAIYISGKSEVLCGEVACFKVEITREQYVTLPVSWNKIEGPVREDGSVRVDLILKSDKYKGSDHRQLLIHNVCKKDEAGYEAVIIGDGNHKIASNEIVLRASGDPPGLNDLNVRANDKELHIDYSFGVSNHLPVLKEIKWSKNNVELDLSNAKYRGGGLYDKCITISSPNKEDEGVYTCIVSSAAGSITKQVKIDLPSAIVTSSTKVICGSDTRLSCCVSGCPYPDKVQWQKSIDGETFISIDGWNGKYHLDSGDQYPTLILQNAEFGDQQYYRVIVSNALAECTSNKIFLQVIGDKPNISGGTCALNGRSVKLKFDVFVYDESPAVTEVYWTKKVAKETKEVVIGTSNIRYKVDTNDRSLTIIDVDTNDAGTYRLNATNPVGTTISEAIVLDDPDVSLEKYDEREDGSLCFTMKIKSVPVPNLVQWKIKENNSETIQPLDFNDVDFKGTSHSFPNPVLVIKNKTILENCSFELEVQNRIGRKTDEITQDILGKGRKKIGSFYENGGSGVLFGELFAELAEKFPTGKLKSLKYLMKYACNVKGKLDKANTAGDYFEILWEEDRLTPSDVIAIQYLLQRTECYDLEQKCVEYAEKQKAWYYLCKPADNGYRYVCFHVLEDLCKFSEEDQTKIRKTIAAILHCSLREIKFERYQQSSSFFLVLSIKETFIEKLFAMKQHDKYKLSKLKIDYFSDDFHSVRVKPIAEAKDERKVMSVQTKKSSEPSINFSLPTKLSMILHKPSTKQNTITVVTSTEHCEEIASLLSKENVLAVDCQGVHLGVHGTLTLLQIGTSRGDVYLFDVHTCKDLLSVTKLKDLFESVTIVKVMYNCSKDCGALKQQFNIYLQNVFDVKAAHELLEQQKGRQLFPKLWLDRVCKIYVPDVSVSEYKEEIMRKNAKEDSGFWERRPLSNDMISYAVGNVIHLIKVYEEQKRRIGESDDAFQLTVMKSVNLETNSVWQLEKEECNAYRVQQIIKSIDVEGNENKSVFDFEEESDEWLALQRLDLGEDQKHSELINRLKKDIIKYELNKIEKGMKEDPSGFIAGRFTLELLNKAANHCDKSISKRARKIKRKVENIIRDDISKKYTDQTEIRYLTLTEQAVLRNLPISKTEGLRYPHQVNKLFWRLLEDDLDGKNKFRVEVLNDRDAYERFQNKLHIVLTNPSTPHTLRDKIKYFLENTHSPSLVVDQKLEENRSMELQRAVSQKLEEEKRPDLLRAVDQELKEKQQLELQPAVDQELKEKKRLDLLCAIDQEIEEKKRLEILRAVGQELEEKKRLELLRAVGQELEEKKRLELLRAVDQKSKEENRLE